MQVSAGFGKDERVENASDGKINMRNGEISKVPGPRFSHITARGFFLFPFM